MQNAKWHWDAKPKSIYQTGHQVFFSAYETVQNDGMPICHSQRSFTDYWMWNKMFYSDCANWINKKKDKYTGKTTETSECMHAHTHVHTHTHTHTRTHARTHAHVRLDPTRKWYKKYFSSPPASQVGHHLQLLFCLHWLHVRPIQYCPCTMVRIHHIKIVEYSFSTSIWYKIFTSSRSVSKKNPNVRDSKI